MSNQDRNTAPRKGLVKSLEQRYGSAVNPEISLRESSVPDGPGSSASHRSPSSGILKRIEARGSQNDRYRVAGEIARGGMGAILEAWDEDLRRRIAMKMALPGDDEDERSGRKDLDPRIVGRFLEEAQISGQLEHPGIVPVHELGLDSEGRVYFTMRLIHGRDFERILELVSARQEGWSVTRALGVLLKACEAVAYAHSKGVIHRDLKPANLMVGHFGEVYVMDWGIARVLDREDRHDLRLYNPETPGPVADVDTDGRWDSSGDGTDELYTMEGDVVGTPSFMSPEQARGELEKLDPRSDVYSAGAILYRLLTGTAPFASPGGTPGEIVMNLLNGEPAPVDQLARGTPPELVAITEKAMAREQEDRYPDMLALAEDLRAYLEHRVVRAYQTGAVAEARKWIRRNKPLAASIAAGILALLAGLASSLALKNRSDRNARLAEEQARITAEVNDFLNADLLSAVSPWAEGVDVTVHEVLEAAASRLDGRFPDEPLVEAALRTTIGESFVSLGEAERGLESLERGLELRRRELGEQDPLTIETRVAYLDGVRATGRYEEALETADQTLELSRNALGSEHALSVEAESQRAGILWNLGRLDEAEQAFQSVLPTAQRVQGCEDPKTLAILNKVGGLLRDLGRLEESESRISEVLEIQQRVIGPHQPGTLATANNLAITLADLGKFAEAEALYSSSIETQRRVFGPNHPEVLLTLGNLGNLYLEQERMAEAEKTLSALITLLADKLGPGHPQTLLQQNNLAVCYSEQKKYDEALEVRKRTLASQRRVLGDEHPHTLLSMCNLASIHLETGRLDEAESLYRETVSLKRKTLGSEHPETLITLENLGNVKFRQGEIAEAETLTTEALEARKRSLGPGHHMVARTTLNLAFVIEAKGDRKRAMELFEESAALYRASLGDTHPDTGEVVKDLADRIMANKDYTKAIQLYEEATKIYERAQSDRSDDQAYCLHQMAVCESYRGEAARAIELLRRAVSIRLKQDPTEYVREQLLVSTGNLALYLLKADRFPEAEPVILDYYERTRSLSRRNRHSRNAQRLVLRVYEELGRPEEAERVLGE